MQVFMCVDVHAIGRMLTKVDDEKNYIKINCSTISVYHYTTVTTLLITRTFCWRTADVTSQYPNVHSAVPMQI